MAIPKVSLEIPTQYASLNEIHTLAREAEAAGFARLWVPDHLLAPESLATARQAPAECLMTVAALANVTKKIGLGSLVVVLDQRVAGVVGAQARTLAELSSGRFILGLGLGGFAYRRTMAALGLEAHSVATRAKHLVEAVAALRSNWSETYDQRIPIWLGGRSEPLLRATARLADGWNCPFLAEFVDRSMELDRYCTAEARSPSSLTRSAYCLAAVSRQQEQCNRIVARFQKFADRFGEINRDGLVGDAERVVLRLVEFGRLGVAEIVVHLLGSQDDRRAAVELFGERILPDLAHRAKIGV